MPTSIAPDRPTRVGSVVRYVGAVLVGLAFFAVAVPPDPDAVPPHVSTLVGVDVLVGLAGFLLLPLRFRFPAAVGVTLGVAGAVSSFSGGPWVLAMLSVTKRNPVRVSAPVFLVAAVGSVLYELYHPVAGYSDVGRASLAEAIVYAVLGNGLVFVLGLYFKTREDLLRSLRDRAETAERERAAEAARAAAVERAQHSLAAQARTAERTRIAREMHDVLAHRISTIAMHSGALAYRDDLPHEQVRATAHLIQEHAHTALVELRDVLGVLREPVAADSAGADRSPEPPQPTILDIPALVDEARAAGQEVRLDLRVDPADVPGAVGRHVHRAVQECLTNARKHAPAAAVDVTIDTITGPAPAVRLVAANDLPGDPTPTHPPLPASGLGLLGLAERAALAGGTLDHGPEDGRYVTRLTIPTRGHDG